MGKSIEICADVFEIGYSGPHNSGMNYKLLLNEIIRVGNYKTQARLAARLKVTQPTISRWMTGDQSPDLEQHKVILAEARRLRIVVDGYEQAGELHHSETGTILELDVRAGMGGGGYADREVMRHGNAADPIKPERWQFPVSFVREELKVPSERVLIVEARGDSMSPTISPGERVIVDTSHTVPTPDGIYALRDQLGGTVVKRLQVLRTAAEVPRIKIISDNENHYDEEVGADEIAIIGKVICGLKRY